MFRYLTLYKIGFFNLILCGIILISYSGLQYASIVVVDFLGNLTFLAIALRNLPKFIKRNDGRLFIGRKRTLVVAMSIGFIIILSFSVWNELAPRYLFICSVVWALSIMIIHVFEDPLSAFLHKLFKRGQRIAVMGYNDTSLKIAEKLQRKGKDFFHGHFDYKKNGVFATAQNSDSLTYYIDFAKKNNINEFYVSVPNQYDNDISMLVEEAEKHCIRINFIAPVTSAETGLKVHYIGGLPVIKRYNEPLRHLHNQIIKRVFDLAVSAFVIIFILSWLIPLVSFLVKLESKGAVFFKQLRSGRDNNSFVCLKFRSMQVNKVSDVKQATRNDSRITKVGAFLRKTSLDEFPQFVNVFRGDMSIVGPRPHMLRHTEEYSEQVNHYMVRLYLKPGLTGWAQAHGYRGEIYDIELMKKRVEHDIWYMENWSFFLDVKIMYLTLLNIIKGEKNAY